MVKQKDPKLDSGVDVWVFEMAGLLFPDLAKPVDYPNFSILQVTGKFHPNSKWFHTSMISHSDTF
ncbi:hypothetical protein AMJ86_07245 [bacterium SM23_57]|jgi:hypothetical protein|nr:MAG: hypothetical protein AMJ86_07245 [bacterium SM23_57]